MQFVASQSRGRSLQSGKRGLLGLGLLFWVSDRDTSRESSQLAEDIGWQQAAVSCSRIAAASLEAHMVDADDRVC